VKDQQSTSLLIHSSLMTAARKKTFIIVPHHVQDTPTNSWKQFLGFVCWAMKVET
jgi:hypothetical protein